MLKTSSGFTKKQALLAVLLFSIVIFLLILGKWLVAWSSDSTLKTVDGRESFLMSLGWKIDRESEESKTIVLPKKFEGSMADYNQLQLSQGFDLSKYAGKECRQFTYLVTNYDGEYKDVYATIYIYGKNVIAGDIHTIASDGFMHGIKLPSKL